MLKKLTHSFILLACFATTLSAQDPRFSQFYASPVNLNPAMMGVFEGQWRINANYRDQWSSVLQSTPFRTYAAGFDGRYKLPGDDYVTFGLGALRDQAGLGNLTLNRGQLGVGYMKQLSGGGYRSSDQYLVAGAQLGAGQYSLDWSGLWFSKQFDDATTSVNTSIDNGENQQGKTDLFIDFSAGLMWYALMGDNQSFYVGGAMHHLNSPGISFLGNNEEKLFRRWTAHLGGELPFNENLSLLPAAMAMSQNSSLEAVFGANFRYSNHDWRELALRAGGFWRLANKLDKGIHSDAFIATAMLELERFLFGVSYDVNVSSLKDATNSRGAVEVSIIYVHPEKSRVRVKCPNF